VPPEQLDPGDDDRGTPDHRVERLEGLLLAEPRDPLDQELQVCLSGTEIDVRGLASGASVGDDRLASRFPTVSRLRSFSFAE
jgi:hypothetical protein